MNEAPFYSGGTYLLLEKAAGDHFAAVYVYCACTNVKLGRFGRLLGVSAVGVYNSRNDAFSQMWWRDSVLKATPLDDNVIMAEVRKLASAGRNITDSMPEIYDAVAQEAYYDAWRSTQK